MKTSSSSNPPVPEGTFKDGKLHFVVNLPGPNNTTRQVVYDGAIPRGGKLTLTTCFPGRPIVYSLCQHGRAEVWKWGPKVGGNLWRTTGDISDRWQSLDRTGFGQAVPGRLTQIDIASYIKPGAFGPCCKWG